MSEATFLLLLGAVATALTTVSGILWKVTNKRLNECEDDRKNLWREINSMRISIIEATKECELSHDCPIAKHLQRNGVSGRK